MAHAPTVTGTAANQLVFEAPSEICALLQSVGKRRSVPQRTILFRKGDLPKGVLLVLGGKVALSAGDDCSQLTRIGGKGSLLGLPSTVGNRRYSLTAESLTDVEVCIVPAKRFQQMLASNPVLGMAIVNILSNEVSALRRFASQ
jgi:CRP-like cAMP-binding protein